MPEETLAPKPTGKPPELVSLTGLLFPWLEYAPALLRMPGSPHLYLPCFHTPEKLRALMDRAGTHFSSIKQIEDGPMFLSSFPRTDGTSQIKIIIDPYYTEEDRVRYIEIKLD
jgi:hypothetical protein